MLTVPQDKSLLPKYLAETVEKYLPHTSFTFNNNKQELIISLESSDDSLKKQKLRAVILKEFPTLSWLEDQIIIPWSIITELTVSGVKSKLLETEIIIEQKDHTLQDTILALEENAKDAKNKNLVLILGSSGAGKSTLANYLIGNALKSRKDKLGIAVAYTQKGNYNNVISIHHKSIAGPNTQIVPYTYKDAQFALCDCPGLSDDFTNVFSILSTIQLSNAIAGVISVIDINSFYSSRGDLFRRYVKMLARLLPELLDKEDPICFVISRVSKQQLKMLSTGQLVTELYSIIDSFKKDILESLNQQGLSSNVENDLKSRCQILDLMKARGLIVANIFDQGESRHNIFSSILTAKHQTLDKTKFRVPLTKKLKEYLNQCIESSAIDALSLLQLRETFFQKKEKVLSALNQYIDLDNFYPQLSSIINGAFSSKRLITILKALKNQNCQVIDDKEIENKLTRSELEEIKRQLSDIETDEMISFEKKTAEGIHYWYHPIANRQYEIVYDGEPFERYEEKCEHGTLSQVKINPQEGKYQAIFTVQFNSHGKASVTLYKRKKDLVSNQPIIKTTRAKIISLESTLQANQKTIDNLSQLNLLIQKYSSETEWPKIKNSNKRSFKSNNGELLQLLIELEKYISQSEVCEQELYKMYKSLFAVSKVFYLAYPRFLREYISYIARPQRVMLEFSSQSLTSTTIQSIYVVGDFNQWQEPNFDNKKWLLRHDPSPQRGRPGDWFIILYLPPREQPYKYEFIINGSIRYPNKHLFITVRNPQDNNFNLNEILGFYNPNNYLLSQLNNAHEFTPNQANNNNEILDVDDETWVNRNKSILNQYQQSLINNNNATVETANQEISKHNMEEDENNRQNITKDPSPKKYKIKLNTNLKKQG